MLERRHRALVERDREIGLEAEAEAARAHAARLEAKLELAQQRLERKNARIRQLATRVRELETAGEGKGLRDRLAGLARRR